MSLLDFDAPPARYGVMGNPIAHSKSPTIHQMFAEQTKQRLTYETILVDLGGLENAVGNFAGNLGKGLNVTVPFKEGAFRLLQHHNERALRAKAVNTIIFNDDGTLLGDNTDGVGLVRDIQQNHGLSIADRKVLILGAGGAVRGVLEPLLSEKPKKVVIANRTVTKAERLATDFADIGDIRGCGYEMLSEMGSFDMVINGTAASLHGELPPIPDASITPASVCYDMMYAADPTPFMQWCIERGAVHCFDGLGMLVEQAAESFKLWRGMMPQTEPVISAIRQSLRSA